MEQKITKEKFKKFNEIKNENELMFNVKNVSLMKKQVINLMMMLALIVGAGVSAWAQDGMAPSTVKWVTIGSLQGYSVPDQSGAGNTYLWEVFEHNFAADDSDASISDASLTDASGKVTISASTDPATDITWLEVQEATSTMFAVQCTESTGSCTTIRRFFIGVFDFHIDVALVDDNIGTNPQPDADEAAFCNSWDGDVILNTMDAADIAALNQALENNETASENKVTSSYYQVTISVTAGASGLGIDDYKWRFLYSMPNASNVSIYSITAVTAGATFGTDPTATATTDITLAGYTDDVYTGNNAVFLDATTATYIFEVQTHNLHGQAAPMIYDIQIDQVQLAYAGADATYNNGEKFHADIAVAGQVQITDGATGTRTINQSPDTDTITLTE